MIRKIALGVLALCLAVPVVQLAAPAATVHADQGLGVESTTTFAIDAVAGVVRVSAEMTFTNTIADVVDGNIIRRAFFSSFKLPAPVGAINPVATDANGRVLQVETRFIDGNTDYFLYEVDFASNLFFGETERITVTYDITGLPPRSANPSRVNAAYAAFTAFGIGDDGQVTVRVVAPTGFVVDTFGSAVEVTTEADTVVYTATDIAEPDEFELFVSARSDAALVDRPIVTDAGNEYRLRSWPNDLEWADFVAELVDRGVAELTTLIGAPWPIDGELEVREAFTPYLFGYAGWFSASDKEIEIGEDLDREVVLHELSHAWFSTSWFADRWVNEGFAQAYAARVATALGSNVEPAEQATPDDPGRIALNTWGSPDFVDGADEVEEYGYRTARWVIEQILDEVGVEAMRNVLTAVDARALAYAGDGPPEPSGILTDWRRLLDLVQELTGSERIEELLDELVVTDAQRLQLTERTEARSRYHDLEQAGAEWAPPLAVRTAMAAWAFGKATQLIDGATEILSMRTELDRVAVTLGITLPSLETDYESTTTDFEAVRAKAADLLDAANTLVAAADAEAAERGLFDKVGLIGTDLPTLLDEGRAALAAGDTDQARARAAEVTERLGQAPDVGRFRGLVALGAFLLVDGAVLTLVLLAHRRRRRRRAEVDAATAAAAKTGVAVSDALPVVDAYDLTVFIDEV